MTTSRGTRAALARLLQHSRVSQLRYSSTKAGSSSTATNSQNDQTTSSSSTTSASVASTSQSQLRSKHKDVPRKIPMSSPILDKPLPITFPSETLRSFPSLLHFADPVLDPQPGNFLEQKITAEYPHGATVTLYNDPQHFRPSPPTPADMVLSAGSSGGDEINSEQYLSTITSLTSSEVRNLHRHAIVVKRVTHMTTKGKDSSMYSLVVAGNGNGLVGYGEGKDINASKAGRKAFHQAVKSLDTVHIHKGTDGSRTIETVLKQKWGATVVTLRPRPAGFGLRVPPVVHAICRSAGIRDLSASIQGSTNPMNVVKATLQILWGGAAPIGLGDGLEGEMRRNDKGRGQRERADIERTRGRRISEVHVVKKSPRFRMDSPPPSASG